MRKEILNSIIITVLLISCVYFVTSGLVEGRFSKQTHYNVTTASGITEASSSPWWNSYTNYTGNNSQMMATNLVSLFFNFTVNNSANVDFNGNITNITINITNLFQLDGSSFTGNLTDRARCGPGIMSFGFNMTIYNTQMMRFYPNGSLGYMTGGLSNGTSGSIQNSTCVLQLNVSINGTNLLGANSSLEVIDYITLNVSNYTSKSSSVISFKVGVDSLGPRITNIQVSNGIVTQNVITSGSVFLSNSSNLTIYATITDANIWNNLTVNSNTRPNSQQSNITIWYNVSGVAKARTAGVKAVNMTNLSSCTWLEGASGCIFYATLPFNETYSAEGGNISFVITATDDFNHVTNNSNDGVGYNITFDNTARACEITLPDERFIAYRHYSVSCSGDANETRLYESNSGVEICKDYNACTGDYSPQTSGTLTLECETGDAARNKNICYKEIKIYSRESIYASESAGGVEVPIPTALDISKEAGTTGLSSGQSTTFKYETVDHTIKIDSITSDSVTVTVDGTISVSIPSGGSKELDLTGDGTNDVKITLNRVLLNKADISIEKLAGATVEPQKEVVQEETTSMAWLWWVLIVIVLAVIIYLVVSAKKKK